MDQLKDQDGITAYHGSPHDFDKFDISKVGTGEGAQAYGHGLYFAESEPVAKSYRDTLSQQNIKYLGQTDDVVNRLQEIGVDPEHAHEMAYLAYEGGYNPGKESVHEFFKDDTHLHKYLNNREVVDTLTAYTKAPTPKMYEVKINAHPDHFLDWDKPLQDQPYVMKKLVEAGVIHPDGELTFMYNESPRRGGEMYERLTSPLAGKLTGGKSQKHASDFLHGIGIKGIKYLDAGSRDTGEGSRNYVVFDHDLVNVKRKYAHGGIVNV